MRSIPPRTWQTFAIVLILVGVFLLALGGYLAPFIRTTLNPLVSVQEWLSTRYLAVVEFLTVPRDVASLRQRNAELEDQNAQLEAQIIDLQSQLREADVLYALLDFARSRPENAYKAAAVIGRDPSPFMHYVIIDSGSDDGVRYGMPVVTAQGLVGRITAVTASASRVQLITDPSSVVNVRLKNEESEVQLVGSITGDLTLEMVPQDVAVTAGDLVLTSGIGGTYPSDILIGQVLSTRKVETDIFQTAAVQPAVDFTNLQAVLVITNFQPVEIAPLLPTAVP
ncbi:rod shape-determining protein MreC [Longilinea arvoryzae]|uniref:Cell shape-determining protein MreC n=1 Tax=Longilinea arvoryzae TaxID=360412 RepID=A0A0S7BGY5_9CHLR|nr:rod shape-determining protein MreC [Longilinea arvoryzae]GAP14877.1 rod shape-determining protein MreC [Longilinea arvoryzae]